MSKSIGDVVSKVLTKVSDRHRHLLEIQRRWEKLVGKDVARHTKVVAVRRGVVYVQSDEPGGSYLVSLEKPRLLKGLNAGRRRDIEDLVIRAGSA